MRLSTSPRSAATPATPSSTPRKRLVGTDQQEAFWAEALDGNAHITLSARAGCGKSTSCREAMRRQIERDRTMQVSYLAFNRAIAEEFRVGLPPGATATTMHSAGYAALRAAIPGVGDPARWKTRNIIDTFLPRRDPFTRRLTTAVANLVSHCKGHLLDGLDPAVLDRLAARYGVNISECRRSVHDLVPRVLARCLTQSSIVDFDDMTWLPVMLGLEFPLCATVYVDEAQDLDPCQHAFVRQIAGDGRLIVVGDPYQAIYGFRGADTQSIETLSGQLATTQRGLTRLPLTLTRRCPWSHVELAQVLVPDFAALPDAPEGQIDVDIRPDELLYPGVMVLCRTNAPLVELAYRLVGLGIPVAIQGRDLGAGLARLIESFDVADVGELLRAIERYRATEMMRLAALEDSQGDIETVRDQCDCVIAASRGCQTVAEVLVKIHALFLDVRVADQGRYVLLSSIHRAKGREADHVVILRPDLIPMARGDDQERNIAYVAVTRARERLSFCGQIPSLFEE